MQRISWRMALCCAFGLLSFGIAADRCTATIVASDNFESNSTTGGTGWASAWNFNNGNHYVSGASKIDGTYSLGQYGQGDVASRLVSPSITTTGTGVELKFSFRADWDVVNPGGGFSNSEIGVNVLNASSSTLFTFKFNQGNSQLRLNDGGGDFGPSSSLTFATGNIYDFTFQSAIGSNQYSFQVARRGSSETASGTNYMYSGRTTNSIGGLVFFVTAPSNSGNDGFLDSVSVSAVPEPTAFLFGGLVCSIVGVSHYRKRRKLTSAA